MATIVVTIDLGLHKDHIEKMLSLVPFQISRNVYWQAILDVWLAMYAAHPDEHRFIIHTVVKDTLAYRSEEASDFRNAIEASYLEKSFDTGPAARLNQLLAANCFKFNSTSSDYETIAYEMVEQVFTASLTLAINDLWVLLTGALLPPIQALGSINDIALIKQTPLMLLVRVES